MANKKTIAGLASLLGLGVAAAAVLLLGRRADTAENDAPGPSPEMDAEAENLISFPLKDKYADYSRGVDDPDYVFTLDTPNGAKEVKATKTHYDSYYIGDEVVCRDTGRGFEIV